MRCNFGARVLASKTAQSCAIRCASLAGLVSFVAFSASDIQAGTGSGVMVSLVPQTK
jgi:hypothetical protein